MGTNLNPKYTGVMSIAICAILEAYEPVLREKEEQIQFDLDREGKRILNKQTSKFYAKRLLNKDEIIDIILTSFVVIEKMSRLEYCDWTATELGERLYN